jgi:hypothetical protein
MNKLPTFDLPWFTSVNQLILKLDKDTLKCAPANKL